jgi:hypothetical protein
VSDSSERERHSSVAARQQVTLVELVDRILDKGVVLSGDVTLAVADVDLVQLSLRALLSSVAATERESARRERRPG